MKVVKKPQRYLYLKGVGLFLISYAGTEAGRELYVNGWQGPTFTYYVSSLIFGLLLPLNGILMEKRWERKGIEAT